MKNTAFFSSHGKNCQGQLLWYQYVRRCASVLPSVNNLFKHLVGSGQIKSVMGNRRSRLHESPISMDQIGLLIPRQHRADVFLDEVNHLGLGG